MDVRPPAPVMAFTSAPTSPTTSDDLGATSVSQAQAQSTAFAATDTATTAGVLGGTKGASVDVRLPAHVTALTSSFSRMFYWQPSARMLVSDCRQSVNVGVF